MDTTFILRGECLIANVLVTKEIRNGNPWLSAPVFGGWSAGIMFPALDKKIQVFTVCAGNFPTLVFTCREISCIL